MYNPNPLSPYVLVELRSTFSVWKGQGGIIPCGSLGMDDHAAITDALNKAMELHLPEGITHLGTSIEIKDM